MLEDRIVVIVSQINQASVAKGTIITEIEKLALYYALQEEALKSPRQLRNLAMSAVNRVQNGEARLKYNDLFPYGDRRNQEYYSSFDAIVKSLADHYLAIK